MSRWDRTLFTTLQYFNLPYHGSHPVTHGADPRSSRVSSGSVLVGQLGSARVSSGSARGQLGSAWVSMVQLLRRPRAAPRALALLIFILMCTYPSRTLYQAIRPLSGSLDGRPVCACVCVCVCVRVSRAALGRHDASPGGGARLGRGGEAGLDVVVSAPSDACVNMHERRKTQPVSLSSCEDTLVLLKLPSSPTCRRLWWWLCTTSGQLRKILRCLPANCGPRKEVEL